MTQKPSDLFILVTLIVIVIATLIWLIAPPMEFCHV
jgi:hypothetical protein